MFSHLNDVKDMHGGLIGELEVKNVVSGEG